MRKVLITTIILGIGLPYSLASFQTQKPVRSTESLTTDEIAIYKAVLQRIRSGKSGAPGTLNVSATTYPLDPSFRRSGLSDSGCLKGIQLDNLATTSHSFHELSPDILPNDGARLVDPKKQTKIVNDNDPDKTMREGKSVDTAVKDAFGTALFSLSEIAFDKERTHAVINYTFWCGSLCGNGATWVFEKVGNEWKKTDRNCGGWISQIRPESRCYPALPS
jgi:hypothetical protein